MGAGQTHTLIVKGDGTVWAVGANTNAKLGDGTTTQRLLPVQMTGVANAARAVGGDRHTVVLLNNGTLMAAGYNSSGQIGDGTSTQRSTAVAVSGLTNVIDLVAGADHNLARTAAGLVWAWGANADGQLGDGTTTLRRVPTQIPALSAIATIGVGFDHSLAVDTAGVVSSWGRNSTSQLGDGTVMGRKVPVPISGPAYAWRVATPVFSVASGTYTTDRSVVVTVDTPGVTIHYTRDGMEPTEADQIVAAGGSVLVSETQTLKAKAWKTGMPESATASATYTMEVATPTASPGSGTYTSARDVTLTTATPGSALYYTLDGADPTESSIPYTGPVHVENSLTLKARGFKAGWTESAIRTATYTMNFGTLSAPVLGPVAGSYEGSVVVTMSAQEGATIRYTTNGTTTPTATSAAYTGPITRTSTTPIRAKAFHPDYATSVEAAATYTIVAQRPVLSLGSGSHAPGTTVTITNPDPTVTMRFTLTGADPTASDVTIVSGTTLLVGDFTLKVRGFKTGTLDSVVVAATYTLTAPFSTGALSSGSAHTLLATPGGLLYAWGENANGRLGDGTLTDRSTPTLISTLTGVTAVSAGTQHSLAVTVDGRVFAWGYNSSGRLGDGTSTTRNRPVPITSLTSIVSVAAGDSHSLALTADGRVYAWGSGTSGRLGLGSTTSYNIPMLVPGLANVIEIAAGTSHSLAVTSSGQLYAWGANGSSRLGDGTTTNRTSPTLIGTGGAPVLDVVAGDAHSVALMQDGTVRAWGAGSSGQLGLGTTTVRSTPTQIPGLTAADLAAAENHTLAVRSDGVLMGWGANAAGQLGDTTTTMRTAPTVAMGPASVGVLTAGGTHAVAVTPDGHVWTWGEGLSGRLGDGTLIARPTPADVFTAAGLWGRTPAPRLSVVSGTYNTVQTVLVSNLSAQAVMRYTLTGAEPTESDTEVPANGQVEVEQPLTLRVRAWVLGRPPSAIVSATYAFQAGTPMLSPGSGSYGTPQTVPVAIETVTPDAVLYYTTDGSIPTEASALYTGPISVATTTNITAKAFHTGWAASATTTGVFTFNFGVLATPMASPGGGAYGQAQNVSLTGPAGATVRYTLDGSDPSATSLIYSEPLTIGGGNTTLKARAFQADWTQSAVVTETYSVDLTSPSITARVWPSATAAGWHNGQVTVSFVCADASGVLSCPSPVVIDQEGAGQVVERTITDTWGHQASVEVTINVDRAAPQVSVTAPADGLTTSDTSVTVTGEVADALSGIASAACNGVAATVTSGQAECVVALQPGRNTIAVFVRDAAGNGTSAAVRVTRVGTATTLRLNPGARTLLVSESQAFIPTDNYGVIAASATWESSDTTVATVDSAGVVTGLAAGDATITATAVGLTAEATVTVLTGTSLPYGTTRWTVAPSPGLTMLSPIYTHRVDETVPDLFSVEGDESTGDGAYVVRAMTASGSTLWTEQAPGEPIMGDAFGGVIAEVRDSDWMRRGLARFAGPASTASWRYDSAFEVRGAAQAPDGTIYALEQLPGTPNLGSAVNSIWGTNYNLFDKYILILNGQNGQVISRIPLERQVDVWNVLTGEGGQCDARLGRTFARVDRSSPEGRSSAPTAPRTCSWRTRRTRCRGGVTWRNSQAAQGCGRRR